MDHELKQRLIGAIVVTALAAIFIPMLFDDPVDTSGKTVTELAIPQAPMDTAPSTAQNLPDNKAEVLARTDTDLAVSEDEDIEQANPSSENPTIEAPNNQPAAQSVMGEGLPGQMPDPSEQPTKKEVESTGEPGLVNGSVREQPDSQAKITEAPIEVVKKPQIVTEKTAKKSIVPEKPKAKVAASTEKSKLTAKSEKTANQKTSSKLVRYSLQAGSFSKKENAQALVEKLRKQGLPASVVSKGGFFRVKVGPELEKNKAKEIRAKLDKQNISSLLMSE